MMADRFVTTTSGSGDTLHAARLAQGWDLSAETTLSVDPRGRFFPRRLARQVRQDIWRALRAQRGYAPMVSVSPLAPDRVCLRAGGSLLASAGASAAQTERLTARLTAVLTQPANRTRWIAQSTVHTPPEETPC